MIKTSINDTNINILGQKLNTLLAVRTNQIGISRINIESNKLL